MSKIKIIFLLICLLNLAVLIYIYLDYRALKKEIYSFGLLHSQGTIHLRQKIWEECMLERKIDLAKKTVLEVRPEEKIKTFYILNQEGVVRYASRPEFLGQTYREDSCRWVQLHNQPYFVLKEREAIFVSLVPVVCKPPCRNCHGAVKTIAYLGLDLNLEKEIGCLSRRIQGVFLTGLFVLFALSLTLLLYFQFKSSEKILLLGAVSGALAQQLRNPLASLTSVVYYLKKTLIRERPELSKIVEHIDLSVKDAERMVGHLLDLGEIFPSRVEMVNLNQIIEEVIKEVDSRGLLKEIKVNKILEPLLPLLSTDRRKVYQIILNLVTNALEAMPKGGEITITTRMIANKFVEIRIEDTGRGIAEKDLKKIFEPEFTTKPQAAGMGLVIVKKNIQDLGGRVRISSVLGKGTSVLVELPLEQRKIGGKGGK